jgi:hypothetical protein
MSYLVAGIIALIFALLLGRWIAVAQPATVARTLRWTLGIVVAIALLFVIWAGRYQLAAVVLPFLIPALMRWRTIRRWRRNARGPRPGQASSIKTAFLRMTLDHDTGDFDGEVVAGRFAGWRLRGMHLEELLALRAECAGDEASVRILEAYLDRHHGAAWRAGADRQERAAHAGGGGTSRAMTREEAYAILGLEPGADETAVKSAHRQLMARFHPDRGGSDYLAALINRARDLLLGRP